MGGVYTNQPTIGRSILRGGVLLVLFGPLFLFCLLTIKFIVYAVAWAVSVVVVAAVYVVTFAAYIASESSGRFDSSRRMNGQLLK